MNLDVWIFGVLNFNDQLSNHQFSNNNQNSNAKIPLALAGKKSNLQSRQQENKFSMSSS